MIDPGRDLDRRVTPSPGRATGRIGLRLGRDRTPTQHAAEGGRSAAHAFPTGLSLALGVGLGLVAAVAPPVALADVPTPVVGALTLAQGDAALMRVERFAVRAALHIDDAGRFGPPGACELRLWIEGRSDAAALQVEQSFVYEPTHPLDGVGHEHSVAHLSRPSRALESQVATPLMARLRDDPGLTGSAAGTRFALERPALDAPWRLQADIALDTVASLPDPGQDPTPFTLRIVFDAPIEIDGTLEAAGLRLDVCPAPSTAAAYPLPLLARAPSRSAAAEPALKFEVSPL